MKKSILIFVSIIMLFLLVFSCSHAEENSRLPDDSVNLKGAVTNKKEETDERGTYNVTHLLNYLHGYIKSQVSEDFKYYESIPERKEVAWFFENFRNNLNLGDEADEWVLDNIRSGDILVFGTIANNINVAALIFPEGLEILEEFNGKKGIFINSKTNLECEQTWISRWGDSPGKNCYCHVFTSCYWEDCFPCHEYDQDFNFEDLLDLDQWIIDDRVFEKTGSVPVGEINIGDPVLQLESK